jgi:hypothetical protein
VVAIVICDGSVSSANFEVDKDYSVMDYDAVFIGKVDGVGTANSV